jgi:hypothetical protein
MKLLITAFLLILGQANGTPKVSESKPIERGAIVSARSVSKFSAQESKYSEDQRRIAEFIHIVQPKMGKDYANQVSHWIVGSAAHVDIDPYIVAATAYKESKFVMHTRPQVGIMQFTKSTFNSIYAPKGLKIDNPRDNILAGADYLAMHLRGDGRSRLARPRGGTTASRSGARGERGESAKNTAAQMSRMWGRYNGCGPNGDYVRRAFDVHDKIKNGTPEQWKAWTKNGRSMWLQPNREGPKKK